MSQSKCARTACPITDNLVFRHRDLGGLYCPRCAHAIMRANNAPDLFTREEGTNIPQPGDRVLYHGRHKNMVRGVLAERAISPLTNNPRYRVVDTAQEISDPEAGRWIDINDVIRFDQE